MNPQPRNATLPAAAHDAIRPGEVFQPSAIRAVGSLLGLAAMAALVVALFGGWAAFPQGVLGWAAILALVVGTVRLPRSVAIDADGLRISRWLGETVIPRSAISRSVAPYDPESGEWWPFLTVHVWGGRQVTIPLSLFSHKDREAMRSSPWLRVDTEALESPPGGE